jgi:predicted permease
VGPPIPVPLNLDLGLDGTVFLFTLGASVLSGTVFGLAPALQTTRPDLAPTLKGGGREGQQKRRFHLQNFLVGLQVAVSMVLLVGGALFLRSLITVQNTDPGFSTEAAGIAWLDLAASEIPQDTRETLWRDLKERILAQPGIRAVTAASRLPLSLSSDFTTFRIPGVEPPSGEEGFRLDVVYVDPGYFRTMGIPLLSGRSFSPADDASAPGVVMVNQAMANRFWPGESPVGKQLLAPNREEPLTVAGVVGNTSVQSLSESAVPLVYHPLAQARHPPLQILARGDLPPGEVTRLLGDVIRQHYPHVLIMELKTMRQHLALRLFGPRAAASLLGIFGALALLLSSIGLYGVVSFSVSRRIREMGIRMSLGAARRDVLRLVVGRSMAVVAGGALVGMGLALALARLIQGFLVGVSATDPVTLLAVPLLLGATAFLAALIPALQATRVSPVEALRTD